METPGNQVDETVQEIETPTLSDQGVDTRDAEETQLTAVETGNAGGNRLTGAETGDAEETQLTGVETGDAEETRLTGVESGDPGETSQCPDRSEEEHEQISGAARDENNRLQRKIFLLTMLQFEKCRKKVFEAVDTEDAGETQQGHDRRKEEHDQISGASGSENNPLQEESTGLVKLAAYSEAGAGTQRLPVKLDAYSEAGATEDELLEKWGKSFRSMMELINSHILFGQGDSIMDAARTIKEHLSQPPKPFEIQDWMFVAEELEYCPGKLIFLWCACRSADGNQPNQAHDIAWCLDRMNGVVIETVNEIERGRLANLLCLLSEDLLETLKDIGDDWFRHITTRCFRNKASGLVQQFRFCEGIQVYESCIAKMRRRLGANVMLGQFLTMLGKLRLSLVAGSPEGLKNLRDARTVLHNAVTTSAFEKQCRIGLLDLIDNTLEVKRDEKVSTSEPEGSRRETSLREAKRKFVRNFRTFFQRFLKRGKRSSDPSTCRSQDELLD